MLKYDFKNLSPFEFETLTKDLLQKKMKIDFESFSEGKDNGIDLRYLLNSRQQLIVQIKSNKEFNSLFSALKKEIPKVKKLDPERYILVTAIDLSPSQKEKVFKLFAPYIKLQNDIITRSDLNNYISSFPEIESSHYKLWLSSTTVLERILHTKEINQSEFEINETKAKAKLYVQNDSFEDAINILKENNYVIISGIPGIGKTTLARSLVLWFLSKDYEEFIYLPDSIDDAYTLFKPHRKQIFFFDDFLGKNFFSSKHLQNIDEKIIKFIERIRGSKNKIFILTTREYILKLAQSAFESFNSPKISLAKCTIDLEKYTLLIRAKILYNHLYFSEIPKKYIKNLIVNNNYLIIVNHANYNPRIIETILDRGIWKDCKSKDFLQTFKSFFDNPKSIWYHTFENTLDSISQYILLVLSTLCNPIYLDDLKLAFKSCISSNPNLSHVYFDEISFSKSIRQLEDTFIKTYLVDTKVIVEYKNPSILDFLVNYLRANKSLISMLISGFIFVEQYFTIFTTTKASEKVYNEKILISVDSSRKLLSRLQESYSTIKSAKINRKSKVNSNIVKYENSSFYYSFMRNVLSEFGESNPIANTFISKEFFRGIFINTSEIIEQIAYVQLIYLYKRSFEIVDNLEDILMNFSKYISEVRNLKIFYQLRAINPTKFDEIANKNSFQKRIKKAIKMEINNEKNGNLYDLKDKIRWVQESFKINLYHDIRIVEEYIDDCYFELGKIHKESWHAPKNNKSKELKTYEEKLDMIADIFRSLI